MLANILTNDQLMTAAPSIFAEQAYSAMSDKYKFIPTINVVDAMRDSGFHPVKAMQSNCRIEGKADFTKHMIRFRHADFINLSNVGAELPEIVMINSHDGSSAYQLLAGIFRLVCSNGMVVRSSDMGGLSARHSGKGDVIQNVIEGSFKVLDEAKESFTAIDRFKAVELSYDQQKAFATAALEIKGEDAAKTFDPMRMLHARRREDISNDETRARDLWRTFNVVQENMIRGGVSGRSASGRRATSRAVKSVNEDIRINKALWRLTDEMSKLVA